MMNLFIKNHERKFLCILVMVSTWILSDAMPIKAGSTFLDNNKDQHKKRLRGYDMTSLSQQDDDAEEGKRFLMIDGSDDEKVIVESQRDDVMIIVEYNTEEARELVKSCAKEIVYGDASEAKTMHIKADPTCVDQLQNNPGIVQIDYEFPVQGIPTIFEEDDDDDDSDIPTRSLQETVTWGAQMIQADQVDQPDNEDIIVCIADTGIAIGHTDFNASMIDGTDHSRFWGPPMHWNVDHNGHGTHVAGTVAAIEGNGRGIAGLSRVRLHIARALDDNSQGNEYDTRKAIESCVLAGAKIINLSVGTPYMSYLFNGLLRHVVQDLGVMVIAAAGNGGPTGAPVYPAAHPDVIAVSAVKWDATIWSGSTAGPQVELAAPGSRILSTTVATAAVRHIGPDKETALPALKLTTSPTAPTSAEGELVDCGDGSSRCGAARNGKICFMTKGAGSTPTPIATMLENCERKGGAGAILNGYDMNSVQHTGGLGSIGIPVVAVSNPDGGRVRNLFGQIVTIGDPEGDGIEYTYEYYSGTSMASPHVAGAAAILWSHHGDCTNHQIRYAMLETAWNPNNNACDVNYGYGIIQVKDADEWLTNNPCSTWDVPDPNTLGRCI